MARDLDREKTALQETGMTVVTSPTVTELVDLCETLAIGGEDLKVQGPVKLQVDASSRERE